METIINWEGKKVKFKTHSSIDPMARMVMESMIERTLEVYKINGQPEYGGISAYMNKEYLFLITKKEDGLYLDFATKTDYDNNKLPQEIQDGISHQFKGCELFPTNLRTFPVSDSDKNLPWMK